MDWESGVSGGQSIGREEYREGRVSGERSIGRAELPAKDKLAARGGRLITCNQRQRGLTKMGTMMVGGA